MRVYGFSRKQMRQALELANQQGIPVSLAAELLRSRHTSTAISIEKFLANLQVREMTVAEWNHLKESEAHVGKALNNVQRVGSAKPLGNLPLYTLELIGAIRNDSDFVDRFIADLRTGGRVAVIVPARGDMHKTALHVYDPVALQRLLDQHRTLLNRGGLPNHAKAFVGYIARHVVPEGNSAVSVIAEAFADQHDAAAPTAEPSRPAVGSPVGEVNRAPEAARLAEPLAAWPIQPVPLEVSLNGAVQVGVTDHKPYYPIYALLDHRFVVEKPAITSALRARAAYVLACRLGYAGVNPAQLAFHPGDAGTVVSRVETYFGHAIESVLTTPEARQAFENAVEIRPPYSGIADAYHALAVRFGASFVEADLFRIFFGAWDSYLLEQWRIQESAGGTPDVRWIDYGAGFSGTTSDFRAYAAARWGDLLAHGRSMLERLASLSDADLEAVAAEVYGEPMRAFLARYSVAAQVGLNLEAGKKILLLSLQYRREMLRNIWMERMSGDPHPAGLSAETGHAAPTLVTAPPADTKTRKALDSELEAAPTAPAQSEDRIPQLELKYPVPRIPRIPQTTTREAVKAILAAHFPEGPELDRALSLFGDLLANSEERRDFFTRMMRFLNAHRRGTALSRQDLHDLLDWVSSGYQGSGRLDALVFAGQGIRHAEMPDELLERIVQQRIPRRYFAEAYAAYREAKDTQSQGWTGQFRRLYQTHIRAKGKPPLHTTANLDHTPVPAWTQALPARPGDLFTVSVHPSWNGEVYFELADAGLASQIRASGFYPNFTPTLYYMELEVTATGLRIEAHQPVLFTNPQVRTAAPEIDQFLRQVPATCLKILVERSAEIASALWPDRPVGVRTVDMTTTAYQMARWPHMTADTAMRLYTELPIAQGFQLVEPTPAPSPSALPSSFWLWRISLTESQALSHGRVNTNSLLELPKAYRTPLYGDAAQTDGNVPSLTQDTLGCATLELCHERTLNVTAPSDGDMYDRLSGGESEPGTTPSAGGSTEMGATAGERETPVPAPKNLNRYPDDIGTPDTRRDTARSGSESGMGVTAQVSASYVNKMRDARATGVDKWRLVPFVVDHLARLIKQGNSQIHVVEIGASRGDVLGAVEQALADAEPSTIPYSPVHYTALDMNEGLLALGRARYPNFSFVPFDLLTDDFHAWRGTQDIVICPNVLHEIFSSARLPDGTIDAVRGEQLVRETVQHLVGMLKPGGLFVVFDGILPDGSDRLVRVRFKHPIARERFEFFLAHYAAFKTSPVWDVRTGEMELPMYYLARYLLKYYDLPLLPSWKAFEMGRWASLTPDFQDYLRLKMSEDYDDSAIWEIERHESAQYFTQPQFTKLLNEAGVHPLYIERMFSFPEAKQLDVEILTKDIPFPEQKILIVSTTDTLAITPPGESRGPGNAPSAEGSTEAEAMAGKRLDAEARARRMP